MLKIRMKKIRNVLISTYLIWSKSVVAFAASDASSEKLVTGTKALVDWATNIEMILSGVIAGALVIKELLKIQAASEDTDTKPYWKRIRVIVGAGIGAILAGGIIKTIFSFYQ